MSKTFICIHCGENCLLNIRLKGKQSYCGKKGCQQARKNKWERDKLKDPGYRKARSAQKSIWRKTKPIDRYQKRYRSTHPDYEKVNRGQQKERNRSRADLPNTITTQKIVKTDALPLEGLLSKGLYVVTPYSSHTTQKIVNTDTLIVELQSYRPNPGFSPANGT